MSLQWIADQPSVAKASNASIVSALRRIKAAPASSWRSATYQSIPRKWDALRRLDQSDVIDAVAFSAPTHCVDGWSYASRSIAAVLAGDAHAARHLAYYAQLRAVLSMLANVGIGVFNGVNFSIDQNGLAHRLDVQVDARTSQRVSHQPPTGMGTHAAVWAIISAWSSGPGGASFFDLVRIRGVPLSDALTAIWPGYAKTGAILRLMQAWGADIRRGADDHKSLNVSSYDPHAFNSIPVNTGNSLKFIRDMWLLLEPTLGGGFDNLDRYLFRELNWSQAASFEQGTSLAIGSINKNYDNLPSPIITLASKDFMLGVTEPNPTSLILKAKSSQSNALELIARSILLLRTATAFTHHNLVLAGVNCSAGDLRPWLDRVAVERGFWHVSSPLSDPLLLWQDVDDALVDLGATSKSTITCLHDWASKKIRGIPVISEADRVAIWSFCG